MGSARPIEGRLSVAAQGALATNGQELVPTCTNGLLYISLCSWYKKNIKKLPKSVKASIQDMGFPAINIHKPRCPGAPGALHPCAHLHIHWHFDPWWAMPSHEKLTAFLAPGRRFLTQLECKDVDVDDESWAYQPWKWFTLIHHVIPIRYDANQSSFLRLTFFYPSPTCRMCLSSQKQFRWHFCLWLAKLGCCLPGGDALDLQGQWCLSSWCGEK